MQRFAILSDNGYVTAYVYDADDQRQAVIKSLLRPKPQWISDGHEATTIELHDGDLSSFAGHVDTSATVSVNRVEQMLRRHYL